MNNINMDNQYNQPEQTVTIEIPTDSPTIVQSETPTQTINSQEPIKEDLPQENIQPPQPEINPEINLTEPVNPPPVQIETQPIKEEIIEKPKVGRPCKYCQNKEYYQKIVDDYLKLHQEAIKPSIPWIEEIALKLNIDDYTFTLWAKKEKNGEKTEGGETELEHPELSSAYTILKSLQKLRLKQRALGRFNPHGALYLLNADHKVIQTNKTELGNTDHEPLIIQVVEEKKNE